MSELRVIAETVKSCSQCPCGSQRKRAVPGSGPGSATVMFVLDSPSKADDSSGEALSGKEGAHFDLLLSAARFPREVVFVTHLLKCKPAGRFPEDDSAKTCLGYLRQQIDAIKPKAIVLMGRNALDLLLFEGTGRSPDPFTQNVGCFFRRRDRFGDIRFAVCYPPLHLLKNQSPEDEELCAGTLSDLWLFVNARLRGEAAPALQLQDLYTAPPPMWQSRSLWR